MSADFLFRLPGFRRPVWLRSDINVQISAGCPQIDLDLYQTPALIGLHAVRLPDQCYLNGAVFFILFFKVRLVGYSIESQPFISLCPVNCDQNEKAGGVNKHTEASSTVLYLLFCQQTLLILKIST